MSKKNKEKKGFFKEFGEFIARGNVLDLAVAVIIGAAFGAIVTSLNKDIIMPLVTLAMGKNSVAALCLTLKEAVVDPLTGEIIQEALTWNYGNFLQSVIDFLIIAFVVFLFVKICMKIKETSNAIQEKVSTAIENARSEKEEQTVETTVETTETTEKE